MQRQRSSVSTLPENLSFSNVSTGAESGIELQMSWSSMHSSVQTLLPEYRISSSDTNIPYLHNANREGQNSEWIIAQRSSDPEQNKVDPNGGMTGLTRAMHSEAAISLGERQSEPPTIFSSDITGVTLIGNTTTNSSFLLHNSRVEVFPQGLNVRSGHINNEDVDVQILESHNNFLSIGSMNDRITSVGGSFDGFPSGFGGRENRSVSLNGRQTSCKRKAFDSVGESSGAGSSNRYESTERSQWHTSPAAPVTVSDNKLPVVIDENPGINNDPELANSRVGTVGEAVAANPFSFIASETAATSHRNFSFPINGSLLQDPVPVDASSTESFDFSSSLNSSRLVINNHSFDLNPEPVSENGSLHGQSALLHIPFVRRNLQSRWNGPSSSRTSRSSTSAISSESNAAVSEEANRRNLPRDISDHPIFVPASDRRSSSQHPINCNFASGNNSVAGNVTSTSHAGSSSRVNSPAPLSNRSYPHYSRRLSDVVRRSLLSSAQSGYGTQSINLAPQSSSNATSQERAFTFGSDSQGNHLLNLRATLVEQQPDGAGAISYPLRTLSSSSEGISAIMSEQIRRVLDIMGRGEGLRLEDVTLLDHSIFYGMADIHDRHRDMRLDVDNMSYEELLALEESIGDVCTGLNEEKITKGLRIKKHVGSSATNPVEALEPCSICREEYIAGDDIGTLDCCHDFHKDCIKQWLFCKNVCPICKTTGLS